MRMSSRGRKHAASRTLKIRISKAIWNACKPPTRRLTRSTTESLSAGVPAATYTTGTLATTASIQPKTSTAEITGTATKRIRPSDCKIRLWAFHYGGPKRGVKGKATNDIEYSTPCLQHTCKTCLRWHPHLIHEPEPRNEKSVQEACHEPAIVIEPISPDIDPRILDGSWQFYQSRRGSAASAKGSTQLDMIITPQLTPLKHSFASDISFPSAAPIPHPPLNSLSSAVKWQISLPVKLIDQATGITSARSYWRATPRKQYVARLMFSSREGKVKFVDLLSNRERKLKKRIYDRERRERMKAASKGTGGAS